MLQKFIVSFSFLISVFYAYPQVNFEIVQSEDQKRQNLNRLVDVARSGNLLELEELLNQGYDPNHLIRSRVVNFDGTTSDKIRHILINLAQDCNSYKAIQFLIDSRKLDLRLINLPSIRIVNTPLFYAAQKNCIENVKTLIKNGAQLELQKGLHHNESGRLIDQLASYLKLSYLKELALKLALIVYGFEQVSGQSLDPNLWLDILPLKDENSDLRDLLIPVLRSSKIKIGKQELGAEKLILDMASYYLDKVYKKEKKEE